MKKKVRPDVVAGGSAIDLGNNFYLMKGRTHKQGGIDIGKNPRTGIEVENNEVVQVTPNNVRVFSAQPILNGISPAEALLNGGNPRNIFNAQETWKQVNRVTDDGKKFGDGGYTPSKEIIDYIKKTEAFRDKWYKDGNGIDTIGYGFTGEKVKKLFPNGITREQADKYFADSIAKRAVILARDTPNWDILSQNQRDALLSYHYNIGEGSYRNKHKNLQKALTEKDWETAILNIDAGYNDKKNPGLRKRRDYERALFRSGSTSSLTGDEEKQFRDWYDRYSRSHDLNPNPDAKEHFYDYRGYWKNRTLEDANIEWQLDSHLPDTYKLPGHPTFSTQSRYSNKKTPGGTWKKVGLGPIYDEQFVDFKYTKRLKTFQNASYAMGGEKRNGQIEPSVITAKLPAKFNGSQAAARRYAEGYQFGKRIAEKRDKTVPYIAATAALPFIIGEGVAGGIATNTAINAFRTAHPLLAKGVSTLLTADGIRNAFSKNGVQKTVRLAKEGKTGRAVLSGLGDVADLAGFLDVASTTKRILNPAYRSLHFYNTITPFSYDDPIKRGTEWVKNMIANTPVNIDNPLWMIGKRGEQTKKMANEVGGALGWRNSIFTDKGRIALEARDDAFRIYNGLPQKYGTFIKNKNGTYSYNLPKLKYENGSFKPVIGENYDTIGAAGGRVKESILNNLDGDVVVRHEDLWDLQPFKNKNTARIIDGYINNSVQKLREKITFPLSEKSKLFRPLDNSLNRFRGNYHLSESKYANKINKFFNDFEAGQITGSKPFKLDTKFSGHSTYDFIDDLGTGHPIRYIDGPAQNVLFNTKFPDEITKFNYSNVNINDYIPNIKMTKKYGGIHIKPSKRGTFTAAAKRHHMSVQEFARKVLNNRAQFSAAMIKKANFARNASKWHKKEFGGDMTKQFYITPRNIYKLGGDVRPKAVLGKQTEEYERYYDNNGRTYYRIGNTTYSKDGFARQTGMNFDEIDAYFDAIDNGGRGEISPSIITANRTVNNRILQKTTPFIDYLNGINYFGEPKAEIEPAIITAERKPLVSQSTINPSIITASKPSNAKSFRSEADIEPAIITARRKPKNGVRQNTIGFTDSIAGVSYYGPERNVELPEQQNYTPPIQRTRLPIDTSGRPTTRAIGFAQLRPYDGRPIEINSAVTTPATTPATTSTPQEQRINNNSPTRSSIPAVSELPIDYDAINKQINNSNNRILSQTLNSDILTPITGKSITPAGVNTKQGIIGSTRAVPKNPYYSKVNVGLHKVGKFINDNPDLLGLAINWGGNAAASLINRSAIKGMKYPDAPIPLRAEKLPTKVNINPQVSELRENIAGQERLIADNTADSRVALARRQRARNMGSRNFQSLMGEKGNTELQLITADKLNRQGVDNQNVTNYTRWREGLYDFNNKKREMLAENAVAGINNAAEAFAGPEGYLARKEGRNRDILNAGLIAATSPNAQKVIGSKEFEEFLRQLGYKGSFSLLNKRFNG